MPQYRTLQLPNDWSEDQAWAVLEFIRQLETIIWDAYEEQFVTLCGHCGLDPPGTADHPSPLDPNPDNIF
jgi:hypothetical protein